MATAGQLSDVLDDLRAEGEVDSQGRFTLDRAQARAKMQKFQLADARRYVLELVQCAVLRGATTIAFDIDADDMRMRFDGRPFTAAEFDDLWGSIFADGDGADLRGVRQLALGLNAALGATPKSIEVRSGSTRALVRPTRDDEFEVLEPPVSGTTIHVEQRLQLSLIADFIRNLTGTLGEERYVRDRCGYAGVSIILDGKPVAFGPRIAGTLATHSLADAGLDGVVGLLATDEAAHIRLIKDGVWIDSHPLAKCGPGIVAVVVANHLRKDVSLAKIVADDSLAQIAGSIRGERWAVFADLLEQVERGRRTDGPVVTRVRHEVLEFMGPRDLRKRQSAARVAAAVVWPDARCRAPRARAVSLSELAAELAPAAKFGYSTTTHPDLAPEGDPIPQMSKAEAISVGRILGRAPNDVGVELVAAAVVERARRAWRLRTMDPKLPNDGRYLLRGPITGPGVRGEFGVGLQLLDGTPRARGTMWLVREGALLTKLEFASGIPAFDVALEAEFTPTDGYDDVVRDEHLVRACLHMIAGLTNPLAQFVARTTGERPERSVHALVKSWLALVFDPSVRAALWKDLRVPPGKSLDEDAATVLPRLELLTPFLDLPLFHDVRMTKTTLRALVERVARLGAIDELDSVTPLDHALARSISADVMWLGRGDRGILAGLFGESALRSWLPVLEAKRNERDFWLRPVRGFDAVHGEVRMSLQIAGVDPDLWCRRTQHDGIDAVVSLAYGVELGSSPDPELLQRGTVEILHQGRMLTTREIALGIGPIQATVQSTAVAVAANWADVEPGAAFDELVRVVQETAWSLVAALASRFTDLYSQRRWLATVLLHRLVQPDGDEVAKRLPMLAELPLFATLDRGSMSIDEVRAIIREHGVIQWVPSETPGANVGPPPIVREDAVILAALERLVGADKLVDGGDRLRRHGLNARLESMPAIGSLELDPRTVWSAIDIERGQPELAGQVGLSRERSEGGLSLQLCTLGRRVGIVSDTSLPAPLEAIIEDPELPLTAAGAVDTRSKRYGHCIRRCRRAIPGLIQSLCNQFVGLPEADRRAARLLLLRYAQAESEAGPGRRETREAAWAAVRRVPLIADVWGKWHTLEAIEQKSKRRGSVDVVSSPVAVEGDGAAIDRLILFVDPPARAYLATVLQLIDLDHRWAKESAELRAVLGAADFGIPDLRKVAWVDRKSTVAGGLSAHLWIPRTPTDADMLVFTRGNKEVGRAAILPGVPCAGVVSGDGLVLGASGVELDPRQRTSLGKHILSLYESLAKQVPTSNKLDANDREQALAWLVRIDVALKSWSGSSPELQGLGKALQRLRDALGPLISPSLRQAIERAKPETQSGSGPLATPPDVASSSERPTPEQALLATLRADLEWARARHGTLIDRLGLDRMSMASGKPGIAVFEAGIVLQRQHPLVARMLGQLTRGDELDPIDLAFLVSAVYTLMNVVAKEIDEADERAFVGQMAQSLALAARATNRQAPA